MRMPIANILSLYNELTDEERASIVTSLSIHLDKPLQMTASELSDLSQDELNVVDQALQAFINTKAEFPDILDVYDRINVPIDEEAKS
ncbi:hypothetical protein [Paenibacillus silvisoli]|uniref:hypothetical protein n=1 Tax=Paenibacillus silvisoli TaxID=3110539 RepID=UPI002805EF96|nr:hypothetical protein [Paenibacillus silvisoli]